MNPPPAPPRHTAASLLMLGGSLLFATMGALARLASESLSWTLVTFVRTALMLVLAGGLAAAARVEFRFLRPPVLWLRSLAGSLALLSSFYALTHMPLADAVTLFQLHPIWITLLAWPVLGHRPDLKIIVAIVLGMAGVFLVAQPNFAAGRELPTAAAVSSSFFTAVAMISLHQLKAIDLRVVVAHFAGLATLLTGTLALLHPVSVPGPAAPVATSVLLLAAVGLSGTLGQFALTRAYAIGRPSHVAVVALSVIVFGTLYDVLLWDRAFQPTTLAGMALVAAPTAWILASRRIV